jgi:hypothetical protein
MRLLHVNTAIAALLLTACSAVGHQDISKLARFKGASMQEVIAELGAPDQILHEPGGHTLYVYMTRTANTFVAPALPYNPVLVTPQGKTIGIPIPPHAPMQDLNQFKCMATFETDTHGKVFGTTSQGNCDTILNFTNRSDNAAANVSVAKNRN